MKTNTSLSSTRNSQGIAGTVFLVLLSATAFAQNTTLPNPSAGTKASPRLPLHAELARDASREYKAGNLDTALQKATNCIQRFERRAITIQDSYKSTNALVIPPERVTDEAIRREILGRGPLNDVAACYIVIGRTRLAQYEQEPNKKATVAKGLLKKSKEAFEKARTFTYAYVYDPNSPISFWRPAVIASDALGQEPLISYQE